jgi:hypothetical protein
MSSNILKADNGVSSGITGLVYTAGNDGTLQLATTTSGGTATTAVTIDNSQNVGIGITPVYKLDVVGLASQGYFRFKGGATGAGYGSFLNAAGTTIGYLGNGGSGSSNAGAATDFAIRYESNLLFAYGGSSSAAMTLNTSGNLGLGVTPSAWSQGTIFEVGNYGNAIWGNGAGDFRMTQNIYYNGGYKYGNAGNNGSMFSQSNGNFYWNIFTGNQGAGNTPTTNNSAMTLDNSGNLSNTGYILSGTYAKATTYMWAAGAGAAGGYYLGAGSINGCISQASQGSATTTTYIGNASITTVSDIRLKENIVDTTIKAVDTLNKLRVVDHTWNDPSDQCENNRNSRGTWVGLIAQEAQPIIPWLVNKPTEDVDKEGNPQYWHMDYGYSVPLLIKAIQELSAEVTALKAKIGV